VSSTGERSPLVGGSSPPACSSSCSSMASSICSRSEGPSVSSKNLRIVLHRPRLLSASPLPGSPRGLDGLLGLSGIALCFLPIARCVPIWVRNPANRKRLRFERFHGIGILGRQFVVVACEVEQAVDNQVDRVVGQRNALLRGLAGAGLVRQRDVAEQLGRAV